jgi:photosystem II stability/assembly factor-like uncharacterized protein
MAPARGFTFTGKRDRMTASTSTSGSDTAMTNRTRVLGGGGLAGAATLALLVLAGGGRELVAQSAGAGDVNVRVDPAAFRQLQFRSVGPHRGGRVTAAVGVRRQPGTFYMGSTGGGVWKTTDYGITWHPITDGQIESGSIGAIDVPEGHPDVVYVGTGSDGIRSNVIVGKGMHKSIDGGRSWTHVGLRDAGQIGAVRVHPWNPDVAFAAALGSPFGPNEERGVFRTTDGGRSWKKVLYVNDRIGFISLAMNHQNPDEIYAAAWRGERKPWTIISGAPASEGTGLYKTTDGGDTWTRLTEGLPSGLVGKIDVDVSRSNPKVVYALVEAPGEARGVYRSADAGATWQQTSSEFNLIRRPFYYTNIDVDPTNEQVVYVNNEQFFKSTDGGKTFTRLSTPHGDNHGMWINPDDPDVFIQYNDGGANVTQNGGHSWSTQLNQPTAEFYMVSVDNQFPYRLYAPQQDNSTIVVPSVPPVSWRLDAPMQLWMQGPGCETGQIHPRPDGKVIYGVCKGEFGRYSLETGQEKHYWVYPQNRYSHNPNDMKYRFQRQSPFEVSPHDPRVIYHGSQYVHRTTNEGAIWEVISPDLTARDPAKQVISGEPITRDITGEEVFSALYAIEESRLEKGVIWTGSNDGPVHVTRDAGKTWKNVTPPGLPPDARIQNIEDSLHRKGSAYVAAYRYLVNDFEPYIFLTNDYGQTWTRLTDGRNGIPADYPTRVVREDPDREGLLYAGTEFGLFISFDNGAHWQRFQQNLPATPVTDIRVHRKDLVLATMGRSFWIMDDITPLHEIASGGGKITAAPAHFFKPREAYRMRYADQPGPPEAPDQSEYPMVAARIDYYLASAPSEPLKLEILDARGTVIRTVTGEPGAARPAGQAMRAPFRGRPEPRLSTDAGHNRFLWDLRHAGAWEASTKSPGHDGPWAVPGKYQARLSMGGWSATQPLEIRIDPRVAADAVTQADLEQQLDLAIKLRDAISATRRAAARLADARKNAAADAGKRLQELYDKLVTGGGAYPQPMLIDQLSNILRMISQADQKVGKDAFDRYEDLMKEWDTLDAEIQKLTGRTSSQP